MAILEREAHALARRQAGSNLDVLWAMLDHRDDDRFLGLRDVCVLQGHVDARKNVERGDPLFGLSNEARAKGLPLEESDAAPNDMGVRDVVAADDDALYDDSVPLVDGEGGARTSVVERLVQRIPGVHVGEALLLVRIDDPPSCLVELEDVCGLAELEFCDRREPPFRDGMHPRKG